MKKLFLFIIVLAVCIGGFSYSTTGNVVPSFSAKKHTVAISQGLSRTEIANLLGDALAWDKEKRDSFPIIWVQMQWLAFGTHVADAATETFDWSEKDKEVFLTRTTNFIDPSLDPLFPLYVPDSYEFTAEDSVAFVAGEFVSRVKDHHGASLQSFVSQNVSEDVLKNIDIFVEREQELLPDLSPLPPQDLVIEKQDEDVLLRFSTIYYNHGRGPLEFQADPETAGIRRDIERDVFQIVKHEDGTSRKRIAGSFLWHQEHLHYHFEDFAIYDLEVVVVKGPQPDLSGVRMKSTFCIRDVSRIDLDIPNKTDAKYLICGKEKQGISVGWGDTYFYNYPDQLLNITDLPSGRYRLSFIINPADRFDEVSMSNNRSSVVLDIDMDQLSFTVVSEDPTKYPELEHVYPEQDCANCTL